MIVIAEGAWTFGWSSLVAIGTLTLAYVTWRLASATKKMATETTQLARETSEEVAASYRPVMVPGERVRTTLMDEDPHGWTLRIEIRNAGAGPATFIRALHDPSGAVAENWSLGSLAPGETARLAFRVSSHTAMSQILLDYRDLGGRAYSTAIVLDHPQAPAEHIRVYDVRFARDVSFTDLGDAVPQPGLKRLPIEG